MKNSKNGVRIEKKEGCDLFFINPKIYPLDVIYSVANVFLDKAYILLGGDPKKEIVVELRPKEEKKKGEIEKIGGQFSNELLNYTFYKKKVEKNSSILQAFFQEDLLADLQVGMKSKNFEKDFDEEDVNGPKEIAVPWEEKSEEAKNDDSN